MTLGHCRAARYKFTSFIKINVDNFVGMMKNIRGLEAYVRENNVRKRQQRTTGRNKRSEKAKPI